MPAKDVFRYFGYGSNLLKERILVHNPTAKFISIGRLDNFRLCFETFKNKPENYWIGAVANIKESLFEDDYVMGAVWEIALDDVNNLDRQEKNYRPLNVPVTLATYGSTVMCRTYQIEVEVTRDYFPDPYYKKVLISGAKQIQLPSSYIKFLESFSDTGDLTMSPPYLKVLAVLKQLSNKDDLDY